MIRVTVMEFIDRLLPDAVTEGPRRPDQTVIRATDLMDWNWLREWLGVPNIQWKTFQSTWKGWHYVAFSTPFREPPAVVACCSGFAFDFPSLPSLPELKLPTVSPLPDLKLPAVQPLPDLKLPRWTRPDYKEVYSNNFANWFRSAAGDWGVFNWLRDALADYFLRPLGWVVGFAANFMWDVSVKPQADTLNDTLEKFEDTWNVQIVHNFNDVMKSNLEAFANTWNVQIVRNFNDLMKSNLEAFTKTWNMEVVNRLNTTMSTIQEKLLNFIRGLGITPLGVRNVSTIGCYVYSPENTTVYVIAAGRTS
jgi:hypothetical protein